MPQQSARIFYRVLSNGPNWYWEIVDEENAVLARGIAPNTEKARADALTVALHRIGTPPEPYPESGSASTPPNQSLS